MFIKPLSCFALLLCCINAVSQERTNGGGSLVGVTVTGETMLDVIKINLPDFSTEVILPNATEVCNLSTLEMFLKCI